MKHKVGEAIQINYGKPPRKIWVRLVATLNGGDLIARDYQGKFYTTWWETNADRGEKLNPGQRHWRCYSSGIYYLSRGLLQAMVSTREVKIPTLERLQAFCRDKRAEISLLSGKADLPKLVAMTKQFQDLKNFLAKKERWPLVQSRKQLSFILLVRDRLGRVNIGVLQARLSTIDRRFTTELENLMGWLPHYAARLEAVRGLQNSLQRQIVGIQRSLSAMTSHQAFKAGQSTACQITGIKQALRRVIDVLKSLKKIRPFTDWAEFCLGDLIIAHRQVALGDLGKAKDVIWRAVNSCRLRLIGFELEELITDLSLDMIFEQVDAVSYAGRLKRLIGKINQVDEVDFKVPVVSDIKNLLYEVWTDLLKKTLNTGSKRFISAKKKLKEAAGLI